MRRIIHIALAIATMALGLHASAQTEWTQNTACPGWNNPDNFGATFMNANGAMQNCWSGQTGTAVNLPSGHYPNPITQETGISLNTNIITGTALASQTYSGYGNLPNNNNIFAIMSSTANDPNSAGNIPYVPSALFNTSDSNGMPNTQLLRSIRIGDGNSGGQAAALYYELLPTTDNALFIIYYAFVVEAPGHGTEADPSLVIRVMGKNANNQWTQKSDTLAYYISSTPATMSHGQVVIGQGGWVQAGSGYNQIYVKKWTKVVINLSDCLYEPTRIEMLVRDCTWSGHFTYAYIAGECRPMDLRSSGCPPGMDTIVTTLWAPRGMTEYEWSASEYGVSDPTADLNPGMPNSYFTFRQLDIGTENEGHHKYDVKANDFRVMYRPTGAGGTQVPLTDSIGNRQTFRCKMKSAIDPNKPFYTPLYINVQNTKPTMHIDTLFDCEGGVHVWNRSYVPGDPSLVIDSTSTYSFYANTSGAGSPYATLVGTDVEHTFSDSDVQSLIVRTNTTDPTCYSEALYPLKPRHKPDAKMNISKHVLCDADQTTLADQSTDVTYRQWKFLADAGDTTAEYSFIEGTDAQENRTLTRGFTHAIEPIELYVHNDDYILDPATEGDTIWCSDIDRDTVEVFLHPELLVTGDTIVCQGSKTDAVVSAVGMDNCTFEWSNTYGSVTGNIPPGDTLRVAPYAEKSTYYVRVTSEQGCVAWDSIHAYLVNPHLSVLPPDGRICPGTNAIIIGRDADHYSWTAIPPDPTLDGQEMSDTIFVSPSSNTTYRMIGYGSNGCEATPIETDISVLPLPEPMVSLDPPYIDVDDPVMTLTDISTNRATSEWTFNDGTMNTGEKVRHLFTDIMGRDSMLITLNVANALGCQVEYPFYVPILTFTAWFPTAFTPGSEDENARFKLYSINRYEYFNIYIYNRMGNLVYHSSDPSFEWDGTTTDGKPCPQGAYVYTCHYRKPGTPTLEHRTGSITIIR